MTASIQVDPSSYYLAFGFGSLWAVSATRQSLQQIDPASNKVVKRTKLGRQPRFLVAGEGALWVQEQGDGTVVRIDPATGTVSGRVKVANTLQYGDIDAGGGRVWLRTTTDQTFVVIDPQSLAIRARVGKASGSGGLRYSRQACGRRPTTCTRCLGGTSSTALPMTRVLSYVNRRTC